MTRISSYTKVSTKKKPGISFEVSQDECNPVSFKIAELHTDNLPYKPFSPIFHGAEDQRFVVFVPKEYFIAYKDKTSFELSLLGAYWLMGYITYVQKQISDALE